MPRLGFLAAVLIAPLVPVSAASPAEAGRGGLLLPDGYLSTRGSQIVDENGRPVRIASIGWNGTDGLAFAPSGLDEVNYQATMRQMKAGGFNAIRLPWSDLLLHARPAPKQISARFNSELQGLDAMEVIDRIVSYAGEIGLKVIFDHHTNDGGPHGWGGQQANGLWFDRGPGTDDTDGSGTKGTVTAQQFKANTVRLAQRYTGNQTVIGFDLHNEPTAAGRITWGQGGPTDIHAMSEDVGNAIQAVSPQVLIIVEGPQTVHPFGGMAGNAPEGDLSGVHHHPVALKIPNKVVYSVHEYGPAVFDFGINRRPAHLASHMNRVWGWLVRDNIAPVWIGEMGSSLDTRVERTWAQGLLDYMNGKYAASGGPAFAGNQQLVSGSWWVWGDKTGETPNGTLAAWRGDRFRRDQQAMTDQMLFRHRP